MAGRKDGVFPATAIPRHPNPSAEASHAAGAFQALAMLTDGGEAYCKRLEQIGREGRIGWELEEHAKELTRREMVKPACMSLTRLRDELLKRGLYERNQPRWALEIALEEAVRSESRILRIYHAAQKQLTRPSRKHRAGVAKVVGETKRRHRDKRVRKRAAERQVKDEAARARVKTRHVFLSLPVLDDAFEAIDKQLVEDGIFIFNLSRASIATRRNKAPLKPDRLDESYMTVKHPLLFEMLWRKEERGEVIWLKGRDYAYLSRRLSKLPVQPREDDSLAEKLAPLALKDFWWARKWKQVLPTNDALYTHSEQKVLFCLKTNSFEEFVLAEFIHQSNAHTGALSVWGVQTLKARSRVKKRLKLRLPTDPGYGRNPEREDWDPLAPTPRDDEDTGAADAREEAASAGSEAGHQEGAAVAATGVGDKTDDAAEDSSGAGRR